FFYPSFMRGKPGASEALIALTFSRFIQHLIIHQFVQSKSHCFIWTIDASECLCLQFNVVALLLAEKPVWPFRQHILHYFVFDRLQPLLERSLVSPCPQRQ